MVGTAPPLSSQRQAMDWPRATPCERRRHAGSQHVWNVPRGWAYRGGILHGNYSAGENFATLGIPKAPNSLMHTFMCKPMLRSEAERFAKSNGH